MTEIEFEHGLVLAAPDEGYVRSKGLHASDLYGGLYKELQPDRYDKRDKNGKETPMSMVRVEMGFMLEDIIEWVLARRLFGARPDEMRAPHHHTCTQPRKMPPRGKICTCGAGIYFSPDYLFDIDGKLVLGEFKLTWMSTKGAIRDRKFDKYLAQIKLYCYWMGITKARLYIFFVNGDWKTFSPELRAWEITFTQKELEMNYQAMIRFGRRKGLVPK